ncbi:hypothetical protein PHMEG_00039342 [Phytophthora megakarya]|uniref:Crinkler (CRN) n=1 Tax=Phytophthora megakarya TaxID=4795 RepID=A0A225UFM9_9STRA|nr:hypothetical protein PHMEG_00039342 [Phytophthora megakarya]
MEIGYQHPEFYVRKCYPQYYDSVLSLLDGKADVVTVTGTPGIGTSLFFAYFFQRYRAQYKEAAIITACFNRKCKMEEVVVWKKGKVVGQADDDYSVMSALITEMKAEVRSQVNEKELINEILPRDKLIYLYDGPPNAIPKRAKMVCFTSPNGDWFDLLTNTPRRLKVFMPLWDLEELQMAAEEMNLTMSESFKDTNVHHQDGNLERSDALTIDMVERRFNIFDGVARECLSTYPNYVNNEQALIENTIAKMRNDSYLRCGYYGQWGNEPYHCIYHYVPNPDLLVRPTIAEATPYAMRLLAQNLYLDSAERKEEIINSLKYAGGAVTFRDAFFKVDENVRV